MNKQNFVHHFLFFFFSFFLFSATVSAQTNGVISNFQYLSIQKLLDTAEYFNNKNSMDTASVCYNLLINSMAKYDDLELQIRGINAYNEFAIKYRSMGDYRSAYELLIKALILCENTAYESYHKAKIYNNIGNIYLHFGKYDMAKPNFEKSLSWCEDSIGFVTILNNLGTVEIAIGNVDTAFTYINRALQISKQLEDFRLRKMMNNLGKYYQKKEQYDSAFYYFRRSIEDAKMSNKIEDIAMYLSDLGQLFFEVHQPDSAQHYIHLSNTIAEENNFLKILAENYLTLSKIEDSKGKKASAFNYYKTHIALKDSIIDIEVFGDINQFQRLYDASVTNKQIEQFVSEQKVKEQTIRYQRILQLSTLFVLLVVCIGLFVIYFQKRNLGRAYQTLFEKNMKIMELQETSSKKKYSLSDEVQQELVDKILALMEDKSIICDVNFSIDKMAELVQSNYHYVSQTINRTFKKNFRSFVNGYRIEVAQYLFSQPDAVKFTIESVANSVGFKSLKTFRDAFKEVTGVNPNFYLKSIQQGDS